MNLLRFLRHTIAHAPFVDRDDAGDPRFGTVRTLRARVERGQERVAITGGREVLSTTQILLDTEVGELDRFWLDPTNTSSDLALTPQAVRSADSVRGGSRAWMVYL